MCVFCVYRVATPLKGADQTARMICAVLIICVFVVRNATKAGFLLPLRSAFLARENQSKLLTISLDGTEGPFIMWIYPLLDRA